MRPSLGLFVFSALATTAFAQTTSGTSATIVVPVIAQTSSFGSEMTVYNPNAATITVNPVFYDAQNTASPGAKSCTSLSVGANVSKAFTVASQCALPSGSNFGLLVLSESTGTNRFYGYARTQTPQGVGFSTEGFPIENFNDQIQHAIGLKRVAAAAGLPAFQTNCFVETLGSAVSYELRLFDGGTDTQLGSTLSGSLAAFQQFRYLDVLAAAGVAAGNKTNVRAQFTNLTGNNKKLIGFCTVQENTTLSADFRIAKSYGGTPQNAFVQGGNAFGTMTLIGTTDNQPLTVLVNNQPTLRMAAATFDTTVHGVNVINGHSSNNVSTGVYAATISGGGYDDSGIASSNSITGSLGTIGGGAGNMASDDATIGGGVSNTANNTAATVGGGSSNVSSGNSSAVGGGILNTASGGNATVAGGGSNTASGAISTVAGGLGNIATGGGATVGGGTNNTASGDYSTIAGGADNAASGAESFAAGYHANADGQGCFVFADSSSGNPTSCFNPNVFVARALNGFYFYTSGFSDATYAGAQLPAGASAWTALSDRNSKDNIIPVNAREVLDRVAAMPIATWNWKSQDASIRHMGPMAQDFYAGFSLGSDDRHIMTVDAEGVALAAIQGLHQLVQEKDVKIEAQQREIDNLRERMSQVEILREELDALKRALAKLTRDSPVAELATP